VFRGLEKSDVLLEPRHDWFFAQLNHQFSHHFQVLLYLYCFGVLPIPEPTKCVPPPCPSARVVMLILGRLLEVNWECTVLAELLEAELDILSSMQ